MRDEQSWNTEVEILIVEDSATQAEQLKYMLERRGYLVAVARNGMEALDSINRRKPELVLSDIVMPEMDGFQLCRKIKEDERLKTIPVLLLTTLSDPGDVIQGLECGADNFLTKPCDERYLISRIQFISANRQLQKSERGQMGVEVFFADRKYFITSNRLQILNLLLSTYETAVQKNRELGRTQEELRRLNENLEQKVEERTAALRAEIIERKRAEEKVKQLNEELERRVIERTTQLEAANKDLESFSYSISHDLRAPLRAVERFSNILIADHSTQMPLEVQSLLDQINKTAHRMEQLIDDLLRFSRLGRQPLSKNLVDISALVREVLEDLRKIERDRHVEVHVDDLPDVVGDPALLRQVFINLLSNAFKFTRRRDPAVVEVGCRQQADEKIYFVRDNGAGFDMKYAEKLFGVFQRLHSTDQFEGTGVGLSIVHRILQRHGGRIWTEAQTDKGATFYFYLPD